MRQHGARTGARALVLAAGLLGSALAGCAAVECRPLTVMVARKEERARVENVSRGLYRTTETGRLAPVIDPELVREYWVQSPAGDWYRVTHDQFMAAQVNQSIELCR
jgi:hypothetical protein